MASFRQARRSCRFASCMYTSIDLALGFERFRSQTSFGRIVARNPPITRSPKDVVLARTTEFWPDPALRRNAGDSAGERFFGGARSPNRAFPDFQAGRAILIPASHRGQCAVHDTI